MWSCTSSAARCSDVQNHAALLQAQAVPGGCLSFLLQAMLEARKMASSLLFIESRQQAVKADFHLPGAEPFKSLGLFGHRVRRFKPVPSADFRSQQGKQAWWRRQELAGVGSGRLVRWGSSADDGFKTYFWPQMKVPVSAKNAEDAPKVCSYSQSSFSFPQPCLKPSLSQEQDSLS